MKNIKNTSWNYKHCFIAVIVFVISRLIFYSFGIHFDANPIYWYHQYLDFELLRNNLLESVYYLHSQPPLFNLFLGIIVKLSPESFNIIFKIIYFFIGLSNYLILIYLLSKLSINKYLNIIISTIFIVSPAAILYENWLFYTYPVQFLLLLSTLFLFKFNDTNSSKYLHLFFLTLSIIILTRTMFNLVWFIAILILIFFSVELNKKEVLKASIIPAILIILFLLKNIILFGTLGSSWFGMSLGKVTMKYLSQIKKQELVEAKKCSPIILIKPFGHIKEYSGIINKKPLTGVKCLDDEYKSSKEPNYNNINYIEISNSYKKEAIRVLFLHPEGFLKSIIASTYLYYRSPSDYRYFHNDNRSKIDWYDRWFNRIFYGQFEVYTPLSDSRKEITKEQPLELLKYTGIITFFLYTSLIIIIFYILLSKKQMFNDSKIIISYLIFNILWITIIGNLFETDENNRFRFLIEPNYFIILTLLINEFRNKTK